MRKSVRTYLVKITSDKQKYLNGRKREATVQEQNMFGFCINCSFIHLFDD